MFGPISGRNGLGPRSPPFEFVLFFGGVSRIAPQRISGLRVLDFQHDSGHMC